MLNILTLSGSFFMLQVYDRVIPSRSVPTLLGLVFLVSMLYLFQGLLDVIRSRVLVRVGASLDEHLGRQVYDAIVLQPLKTRARGDGLQSLRDLDQVRSFLSSLGPTAFFLIFLGCHYI
jgi:ATP-binding cassette subfamily C protein